MGYILDLQEETLQTTDVRSWSSCSIWSCHSTSSWSCC